MRSVHRRVRGKDEQGGPYAADDPHLLRWVHVAEISVPRAFQAYASQPLTPGEADLYVAQAARSAELLGATDLPMTVAELDEVMASYRPELESTNAAREATRFMLLNPPVPLVARPGYALIAAGGSRCCPPGRGGAPAAPRRPGVTVAARAGAVSAALVRWGMAGLEERPTQRARPRMRSFLRQLPAPRHGCHPAARGAGRLGDDTGDRLVPVAGQAVVAAATGRLPAGVDPAVRRHRRHHRRGPCAARGRGPCRRGRRAAPLARGQPGAEHRVERALLADPATVALDAWCGRSAVTRCSSPDGWARWIRAAPRVRAVPRLVRFATALNASIARRNPR